MHLPMYTLKHGNVTRRWNPDTLTYYWEDELAEHDPATISMEGVIEFLNRIKDDPMKVGEVLHIKRVQ